MNSAERLAALEDALARLREDAVGAAIIVEGRRDVAALEALGIGGTHLLVHQGASLEVRIDAIAEAQAISNWPRLILLLDWDRTGGTLHRRLADGLAGRAPLDSEHRRRLAIACHCKCIEHVPAELAALRRDVTGV